jgi:hypothetical protein
MPISILDISTAWQRTESGTVSVNAASRGKQNLKETGLGI